MALRRMFSLTVIDTDRFLEMPSSARLLYYDLGMRADDDGFVASPKKVMKMTGAAVDDLKLLATKGYIIPFENGICVITDWKQNNYLRADRYIETTYKTEKALLSCDENQSYIMCLPSGIPSDNHVVDSWDTQDRSGQGRTGKTRGRPAKRQD